MINKILVPVDFSHNSADALRFAGEIAFKSGAEVCALHIYSGSKPLRTMSVILEDKMMTFTMHALRRHDKLKLSVKYSFHVVSNVKFINGVLSSGMLAEMDLVIMGTKGAGGLKGVFIGSNTFNLAQKIDKPIIAVPRNTFFQEMKRIMFCSDFNNHKNIERLNPIKDIAKLFNSEVRIVHVRLNASEHPKGEHMNESVEEDNFFGDEVKHVFKIINSGNVLKGISNYLQIKSDIDMVAVVNHKRNTMTNLFRTDHAKELAFHANMPLLILSENRIA